MVLIAPRSVVTVSKSLLNVMSLHKICYSISSTKKLFCSNPKNDYFFFNREKRFIMKMGTCRLKRERELKHILSGQLHYAKDPCI